jgi:predicted amidohydrolase YtcJ
VFGYGYILRQPDKIGCIHSEIPRMDRFLFTSLVATLAFCSTVNAQTSAAVPDIVLRNGHIFTGDKANPWVEAISIRGEHIVLAGSDATVTATAGTQTKVTDLQGRMAMPGINDSHDHVGGAGFGVQLHFPPGHGPHGPGPEPSVAELVEAVKATALTAPQGAWIDGTVGEAVIRHPKETRQALDEAAGDHPVIVSSWWGHGAILNSRGLAKLKLTDAVKDPEGGRFDRDATGHLTGLLEEEAANEVKRGLADEAGVEPSVKAFHNYAQRRLAQGVTTVQVMATNQRLSYLEKTFAQPDDPLRIRIMRFPMALEDARVGEKLGTGEEVLSPRVRVAGVKYVLDGTPIEELAYQTKDYADKPGWRGRPNYPVAFIDQQLTLALNGKDQLMMHIVGDAMTDEVMDEMEKLAPAETWRPLRVRFEHGDGFTTPERMERARKLGIVIAQPRPGRPWKALEAANIPLAYGSDGGMDPWLMFNVMTDPRNPQAIPTDDALSILTSGPAFAEFQETKKGQLSPGMLADVVVLSQDVTKHPAAPIASTHSVLTIIGGSVAFRSEELGPR